MGFDLRKVSGGSAKVYRILLTQRGLADPFIADIENTLGGIPVWTRVAQGIYECTLAGAFPQTSTQVFLGPPIDNTFSSSNINRPTVSDDVIQVQTYDSLGNLQDDCLEFTAFTVIVGL